MPSRPTLALLRASFILAAFGFAGSASATEVRNFFAPEMDGARVDACLGSGGCGKPAADAFCRVQGYDHALLFQRESLASTRLIDSGGTCAGECTAFRQVKCFTTKSDLAQL
jgi:hypothetical protein